MLQQILHEPPIPQPLHGVQTLGAQPCGKHVDGVQGTQGVHKLGVHTLGVHRFGVQTEGVHILGVQILGVHVFGVQTLGVHTLGVHTLGVQTLGVHTSGIQVLGAHTLGVHPTGKQVEGTHPEGKPPVGIQVGAHVGTQGELMHPPQVVVRHKPQPIPCVISPIAPFSRAFVIHPVVA